MEGGLPTHLNQLCFEIFLNCEYFEDFERLRTFCQGIDGLHPLKFKLKTAESIEEMVEKNLPIFIEYHHDSYGWALRILVNSLRLRYQTTQEKLWQDLEILYSEIGKFETHKKHQSIPNKGENLLFNSIIKIDFEEQEEEFINALKVSKIAAFLIHGPEKYGQEILVTRLCRARQLCNGRKIKIKLSGMGKISQLWHEVAKHFFQSEQAVDISEEEIIDKVLECLQTQHIIFIFDEVQHTYIGFLPELIECFWRQMITKVNEQKKYLVMFWVDNQAKICESGISLVYDPYEDEYPKIPLCLTQANRFSYKKLQQWLDKTDPDIITDPDSSFIKNLMKESKSGVPELVYKEICVYYGSSWEGRLAQWLTQ